jgi:predicted aminopeptidase
MSSDNPPTPTTAGIYRITEPKAIVEVHGPMSFVTVTGPASVVNVQGSETPLIAPVPPGRDGPYSTRDPRRADFKAAALARLRDRLKVAAEFAEPGHSNWRAHRAETDLLNKLIIEFEELPGAR